MEKLVEDELGGELIVQAKCHCELNPMELIWGMFKKKLRSICDHTWNGLKLRAKQVLFEARKENAQSVLGCVGTLLGLCGKDAIH